MSSCFPRRDSFEKIRKCLIERGHFVDPRLVEVYRDFTLTLDPNEQLELFQILNGSHAVPVSDLPTHLKDETEIGNKWAEAIYTVTLDRLSEDQREKAEKNCEYFIDEVVSPFEEAIKNRRNGPVPSNA